LQLGDRERGGVVPPVAPSSPTPTDTSTTAPPTTAPEQPDSGEKVWPRWDPRDVDQLPAASDQVAPAIPDVIDPPASSPMLADDPVASAVLAVEQDGLVQVLGNDGGWRTVPIDGRWPVLTLSPSGTQLAIYYLYDSKVP